MYEPVGKESSKNSLDFPLLARLQGRRNLLRPRGRQGSWGNSAEQSETGWLEGERRFRPRWETAEAVRVSTGKRKDQRAASL